MIPAILASVWFVYSAFWFYRAGTDANPEMRTRALMIAILCAILMAHNVLRLFEPA